MKLKKSFTLIEILVVVFIIALIASLVITFFLYPRQKNRDAERETAMQMVGGALVNYYADNGQYPVPVSGTILGPNQPYDEAQFGTAKSDYVSLISTLSTGNYLEKCPRDPQDVSQGCTGNQTTELASFGYRYFCWTRDAIPTATSKCTDYLLLTPTELAQSASTQNASILNGPAYTLCDGKVTNAATCALGAIISSSQSVLHVLSVPVGASINHDGTNAVTPFDITKTLGDSVSLIAPSTFGANTFVRWTVSPTVIAPADGDVDISFSMSSTDITATALYQAPTAYVLTVRSSPVSADGAYISVSPNDNNGLSSGNTTFNRTYNANTNVNLDAETTHNGCTFSSWSGTNGTSDPTTATMNSNKTVTANYNCPSTPPPSTPTPTRTPPSPPPSGGSCNNPNTCTTDSQCCPGTVCGPLRCIGPGNPEICSIYNYPPADQIKSCGVPYCQDDPGKGNGCSHYTGQTCIGTDGQLHPGICANAFGCATNNDNGNYGKCCNKQFDPLGNRMSCTATSDCCPGLSCKSGYCSP